MFLRRLFGRKRKGEHYPRTVEQQMGNNTVNFEVFSSVENFRVAEYGGEKDFLDKFIGGLQVDDVVFDIGASVGLLTVHSAVTVDQGRVVAFEPDLKRLNGFGITSS